MTQRQELPRPRVGLILSGGGAKGAYQEGVFQALARLGVAPLVEAVSGCSIGALNALLFAMGDPALWSRVWDEVGLRSLMPEGGSSGQGMEALGARFRELMEGARQSRSLREFLEGGNLWITTQDSLRELVRREVDPQKLRSGRPRISVCAYDMEEERPRYFWLEGRPFDQVVELAMASSAIPVAFPPVEVEGHHFCDGGIVPPYSGKDNGDKVPASPLAGLGLDLVVVVYLNHYDRIERSLFPSPTKVLELYPSQPLEAAPGTGTMDFTAGSLRRRRALGWQDAMAAFAPLLADWARGESPDQALAEHDARNRVLLEEEQSANEAVRREARRALERLEQVKDRVLGGAGG